jgi:hypothetical protein
MQQMTRKITVPLLAVLAVVASTVPAAAGPWLDAGDRQVRADVELLKAAGVMRGPVNAWPLPWAQISDALERSRGSSLPPHVVAAAERLRRLSDRDEQKSRYEVEARVTNRPSVVRDFGDSAREDGDLGVRAEHDLGRLYLSYGIGYRDKQQGRDVHFETAHAAYALGNWALYGGYVEHWWGPGHDSALLFSTNARAMPRVGIKRLMPYPIDFPVLRWLGPWRLDVFAGVATEDRGDFDNPGIAGIRVAFEPVRGLEIGLNRGLQLCGRGRPCGAGTIFDAIVGISDADNTGTPDEPGNQLAGFDISYTRMFGNVAAQIYTEWEAEDEDNVLIDQFARLAGITLTGGIGDGGASWTFLGEWSDTLAIKFLGSRRYPGSFYNNFIYTDGFTYRDRALGHSLDGDSELLTAGLSVTDSHNRRYYGTYRHVDINKSGLASHRISANRESFDSLEAGIEWPTPYGDISLEARYDGDAPDTPGVTDSKAAFEVGWRTRF